MSAWLRSPQAELSRLLKKRQATLSHIERGKCNARIDTLRRLCKLFGRSADWFLGLDDNGCDTPDGFSQRIVELRKAMRLTQDELAKLLGVGRQALSRWENGWADRRHYLMVFGAFCEGQGVIQDDC